MTALAAEPWHGTPGGYSNHKCRCPKCRAAQKAYSSTWWKRRATEEGELPPGRCDRCGIDYDRYPRYRGSAMCVDCHDVEVSIAKLEAS